MTKRTRDLAAIAIVATTLLSMLVGCGSNDSTEVAPQDTARSQAAQNAAAPAPAPK